MLVGCGSLPMLAKLAIIRDENGDEAMTSLADGLRRGRLPSLRAVLPTRRSRLRQRPAWRSAAASACPPVRELFETERAIAVGVHLRELHLCKQLIKQRLA